MRRRVLLQTIGSTTLAALAGCAHLLPDTGTTQTTTGPQHTPTEQQSSSPPTATSGLELRDHELVRANRGTPNELVTVAGTLVNRGRATATAVTLTATFLDANGDALAESSAETSDLRPDETWSFELTYPGVGSDTRDVTDYTLTLE